MLDTRFDAIRAWRPWDASGGAAVAADAADTAAALGDSHAEVRQMGTETSSIMRPAKQHRLESTADSGGARATAQSAEFSTWSTLSSPSKSDVPLEVRKQRLGQLYAQLQALEMSGES